MPSKYKSRKSRRSRRLRNRKSKKYKSRCRAFGKSNNILGNKKCHICKQPACQEVLFLENGKLKSYYYCNRCKCHNNDINQSLGEKIIKDC